MTFLKFGRKKKLLNIQNKLDAYRQLRTLNSKRESSLANLEFEGGLISQLGTGNDNQIGAQNVSTKTQEMRGIKISKYIIL